MVILNTIFTFFLLLSFESSAFDCNSSALYNQVKKEVKSCETKNVHLTFDDGPDKEVTPIILKELNKRDVKASFFVSTTNLKKNQKNPILISMIKNGHIVANHGHQHHAHDTRIHKKSGKCDQTSLSPKESKRQIELSEKLIQKATGNLYSTQKHKLFRFPYARGVSPSALELETINRFGHGKKNCLKKDKQKKSNYTSSEYAKHLKDYRQLRSPALKNVHNQNLDHIGWNFDSGDSITKNVKAAQSNPDWYAKKIVKDLCKKKYPKDIISLFHDKNKMFNAKSIGNIIDVGRCMGHKFQSYDEILKSKKSLVKSSVILESPRLEVDLIVQLINSLKLASQAVTAPKSRCIEMEKNDFISCKSSNGKKYYLCEGQSSICIGQNQWASKSNILQVGQICPEVYKSCKSSYTKKSIPHCGGVESKCINGKWVEADSITYISYCKANYNKNL